VGNVQRLNDALIAATAESLNDVDTLYTFDRGILELATHVKRVRIEEPPVGYGPLFDPPSSTPTPKA